ncbi:hypothetical protein GCM10007416_29710 [Kroppenstedtia guangzhouensis]|uniref:Uncharacterized protein n=1 Tax=Kroppenstedtia guangzhouensis TaxID=1274356 RepID=A0ABQ1H1D8_9BACL|nr:hypothetical protein GCM10007416_29710 [Kroppenstedtia guangzhouensis]
MVNGFENRDKESLTGFPQEKPLGSIVQPPMLIGVPEKGHTCPDRSAPGQRMTPYPIGYVLTVETHRGLLDTSGSLEYLQYTSF